MTKDLHRGFMTEEESEEKAEAKIARDEANDVRNVKMSAAMIAKIEAETAMLIQQTAMLESKEALNWARRVREKGLHEIEQDRARRLGGFRDDAKEAS